MTSLLIFANKKLLLRAEKSHIHAIHPRTGQLVATLRGHEAEITSLTRSTQNVLHVVSCDALGGIMVWDIMDFKCIKSVNGTGAVSLCGDYLLSKQGDLHRYSLENGLVELSESLVSRKGTEAFGMAQGTRNRYIGIISGNILYLHDTKKGRTIELVHDDILTCLDIHPTEHVVTAGDARGRIIIWRRNNGSFVNDPVVTQWHWHSNVVSCLTFNSDGTYLISGGHEAVMVIWQLETGEKNFLPRLGGAIDYIASSPNSSYHAILTRNNIVKVFDARTMTLTGKLVGLATASAKAQIEMTLNGQTKQKRDSVPTKPLSCIGCVVEPLSSCVVVQKSPGQLQFYDVAKDVEVLSVDVTMKNNISGNAMVHSIVNHVAFSSSSKLKRMVTVESQLKKCSLKFWVLDTSASRSNSTMRGAYVMTTQVEQPHATEVTALLMHPNGKLVVSGSYDGNFKVWRLKSDTGEWSCSSVGFYRNSAISSASMSQDGSIVALAYGKLVSLWSPESNLLLKVLPHQSAIVQLCFFRQTMLATLSYDGVLSVWDVTNCSLVWSLRLPNVACISSTYSTLLAVVDNKKLFVFSDNAVPDDATAIPTDLKNSNIVGCAHVNDNYYCLTKEGELTPLYRETASSVCLSNHISKSAFALVKESTKRKLEALKIPSVRITAKNDDMKSLDAYPSYVLPPISKLIHSFFSQENSKPEKKQKKNENSSRKLVLVKERTNGASESNTTDDENESETHSQTLVKEFKDFFKTLKA